MRRGLFVLLMLMMAAAAFGQLKRAAPKIKAYRAWDSFKNDTLAYLKYNFYDRRAAYIGKPFKTLYNDWEIKPADYLLGLSYVRPAETNRTTFKFNSNSASVKQLRAHHKKDSLLLIVKFTKYYYLDLNQPKWSDSLLQSYSGRTIQDIYMMDYVVPYPAPKGNEKANYRRWDR